VTTYGYCRVSTTGQTLATQKALLKAAGVERIFAEKVSGVAAKRPELEYALDALEAGDVLVVTKLDQNPACCRVRRWPRSASARESRPAGGGPRPSRARLRSCWLTPPSARLWL
jgi:hypothetical protein